MWRLGRIIDLLPSTDGAPRGVTVKVTSKTGQVKILRRPIDHIYPLEVHEQTEEDGKEETSDIHDEEVKLAEISDARDEERELVPRPKRMAARNAREIIKALSENNTEYDNE